jgi:hypothetical protein
VQCHGRDSGVAGSAAEPVYYDRFGRPVEGPVIDGVKHTIQWANDKLACIGHGIVEGKNCLVEKVDRVGEGIKRKWRHVVYAFWITIALLISYSPPLRWLFGKK